MAFRPRSNPRRARRVLLVAGVVIAAGQLAAGLALDAAPPAVRFAQGDRVLGRASALDGAPFVLLLGSSRFWKADVGIASATLVETIGPEAPPIVQGAVLGGDPIVADYLLDRLLAQGSRPVLIAVEVSPEAVCYPAPWIAGQAVRFFTWREVAAWAPEIVARGKLAEVAAARFAPIDLYRRELLTWIVGREPPYLQVSESPVASDIRSRRRAQRAPAGEVRRLGSEPLDAPPPADRPPDAATLSGLRQVRSWLREYRLDGAAATALERFLGRARDAGIRIVLVAVPATSWLRALYTPHVERTFRDYMEGVSQRYGTEFVDYRARVPDRLFSDHYHLNARGGGAFARMLASEVLAPRWLEAIPMRRVGSPP